MKAALIFLGILFLGFMAILGYCCCVVAGRADEQSDRLLDKMRKEQSRGKSK